MSTAVLSLTLRFLVLADYDFILQCGVHYFLYKQLGSGLKIAFIFKVFGAQSCLMVA